MEDSYRVRHDDGSYTWGYKSGDGSFKEETIGADCITRGRQVLTFQSGNEFVLIRTVYFK